MKDKLLLVLLIVILSSCAFFSPTRVADNYFEAIYNSDNYLVNEDNFVNNLTEKIKLMKEVSAPYVTKEQSDSILGGFKLVVTSVVFSIIESNYGFSVEETEYSLNELDSDELNKFYDYKITIKLVDADSNVTYKDFEGIIHLKKVDKEWKVNDDRLLIYDFN